MECYETAGDLGLELLNSISRSTLNLTLSGVLEIALLRSFLLQMSHGMVRLYGQCLVHHVQCGEIAAILGCAGFLPD